MIYTIGHSTHSIEDFITLLNIHSINAVADVRSAPYSKFQSQFNREVLTKSLNQSAIDYVFVGDSIGGRSRNESDYQDGQIVYSRIKNSEQFKNGIQRVIDGSLKYKLVLMCTEKDPLECHRALLVGQSLVEQGIELSHIKSDGKLETHQDLTRRLLKLQNLDVLDLFRDDKEIQEEAFFKQEQKVAFKFRGPFGAKMNLEQVDAIEEGNESA